MLPDMNAAANTSDVKKDVAKVVSYHATKHVYLESRSLSECTSQRLLSRLISFGFRKLFQYTRSVLLDILVTLHRCTNKRRDDLGIEDLVHQRLIVEKVGVARGRIEPQEPHHGQHACRRAQADHVGKPVFDR